MIKVVLKIQIIAFVASFLAFTNFTAAQDIIKGKVTDKATKEPLVGVSVTVPGTLIGASTDNNGNFILSVSGKVDSLSISFIGYKTIMVKAGPSLIIALEPSANTLQEAVITATGIQTTVLRSPVPVTLVTHDMFLQQASTNVVDAIATQPGITAITTGAGVSKPEINGLGYNRVLTLMDGERQEEFQWGDEHGVLIDPYSVNSAEIIRGPASLQYGANAVAGVVSFKSEPLLENGPIQGSMLQEYQTNNGLIGNSEDIGGNNNGFEWDVRASNEEAHCYSDPKDGYVWGTAFNQSNVRAVFGLDKTWGYSHLTVSSLHKQIEIPDGNRDSATGQFEFDVPQSNGYGNPQYYSSGPLKGQLIPGTGQVFPNRANFLSYYPDISSYQILDHNEIWWQNSFNVGMGSIGADIGFSQSHRQEIDTGTVPEENMIVDDIPYSIKYQLENNNLGVELTTGFNGMYEAMHNGPPPPYPYIADCEIPSYHLFDIGGYAILNKDFKNLSISGGLRYDSRVMVGIPKYWLYFFTKREEIVPAGTPGAYEQFPAFNNTYTGFSGSMGATYQLPEDNYVKLNLAKSFRAPAINELASNEVNPGGNLYELGDPNLKPEAGYEADFAYGNKGRDVSFEVDPFGNYIDNFIFQDRLTNIHGGDTTELGKSIFQYKANTAIIAGVAAYFNIHPTDTKWIELDNGFTYIYSFLPHQTDSTQHVPWTPAPRLTSEVKFKLADKHNSIFTKTYFQFGLAKYWAQNNIYSAYYTELPSAPYTLYNAGLGTNFVNRKTGRLFCSFYCNVTNLMNIAYIDHTARTQYFWAYNGKNDPTNYGYAPSIVTNPSEGIYNMGRNVGFKVVFPIGGL